jgi:hypothetical protein
MVGTDLGELTAIGPLPPLTRGLGTPLLLADENQVEGAGLDHAGVDVALLIVFGLAPRAGELVAVDGEVLQLGAAVELEGEAALLVVLVFACLGGGSRASSSR